MVKYLAQRGITKVSYLPISGIVGELLSSPWYNQGELLTYKWYSW